MKILKKILFLLSPSEKAQTAYLLFFSVIVAFLEMLGVVSIMPFIAVLANPKIIETNIILENFFKFSKNIGFNNQEKFLFFLGIIFFLLLIISLFFKAINNYLQLRFIQECEYNISRRLIISYINQPYTWFINRNSADLGKSILSEVSNVVNGALAPMIELISKSMLVITLLILLFITNPQLAFIILILFVGLYGLIYVSTRNFIKKLGEDRVKSNQLRFKAVNESFGAFKEVKVFGLEEYFTNLFSAPARIYAKNTALSLIFGQLPRYAVEAIAFGGMFLIILFLMSKTGTFINSLPIIALYVFSAYRLMPAIQGIYLSLNKLRFVESSIDELFKDIQNSKLNDYQPSDEIISLSKEIKLRNIYFEYPNASRTTLKNIDLSISAFSTIGFIGPTGSGKTTIVDIILGLLDPQKGLLQIDGKTIKKNNLRSWQQSIGYVPQNIYLSDDTLEANIAFGRKDKDINKDLVEKVSKIANLHSFVINELSDKYQTVIGERGVRLSGGQRQRIGIARALYNEPKVLILDEATSSLDVNTEQAVMDAVNNLGKNLTIIIIAHRLNTIKKCDKIFLLENGELKKEGKFDQVIDID